MHRENKILIVLGGSNDEKGHLSEITISRLNLCLDTYQKGDQIICTGGWGPNFNQGPEPHASYSRRYLIKKGIDKTAFLQLVPSANTVEDAVMSMDVLDRQVYTKLIVITSDFHLKRTQLIFNEILNHYSIEYRGASSDLSTEESEFRINHEKQAIEWIKNNGLQY